MEFTANTAETANRLAQCSR